MSALGLCHFAGVTVCVVVFAAHCCCKYTSVALWSELRCSFLRYHVPCPHLTLIQSGQHTRPSGNHVAIRKSFRSWHCGTLNWRLLMLQAGSRRAPEDCLPVVPQLVQALVDV